MLRAILGVRCEGGEEVLGALVGCIFDGRVVGTKDLGGFTFEEEFDEVADEGGVTELEVPPL